MPVPGVSTDVPFSTSAAAFLPALSMIAVGLLLFPGLARATTYEKRIPDGFNAYLLSETALGTYRICHEVGSDDTTPNCTELIPYMLPHGDGDVGLESPALGLAFKVLAPSPGGLRWQQWEPCDQAPEWIEFELLGRFHKVCERSDRGQTTAP